MRRDHLLLLLIPLTCLGLLASASGVAGQGFDQIQTAGAAPIRGVIKAMSPKEVVIDVNGRERTIPANEIVNLTFRDDPVELRNARREIQKGNYRGAMDHLKKIDAAEQRDVLRQDIEFYTALCNSRMALTGAASQKGAVRKMMDFRKANKSSYHYYEAVEELGKLAAALGRFPTAAKFYQELAGSGWPEATMRATILQANALLADQKFNEARPKFEQVRNSGQTGPVADRQKVLATIGIARCLAEEGDAGQGISLVEQIIAREDDKDVELFARAYNAMGACYQKNEKVKDALLAFLHTDILYAHQSDAHAEALFFLAKLWEKVEKKDRALKARSLLKKKYPGSRWASQI